jgi:hypothetical protein
MISFHNLCNSFQLIEIYTTLLTNLPIKESIFVPIGWSGHAVGLEIPKASESHVNLRIFNTGSGNQYHIKRMDSETTYKIIPWITYKMVPIAELKENFWFFKGLCEINSNHYDVSLSIYFLRDNSRSTPKIQMWW